MLQNFQHREWSLLVSTGTTKKDRTVHNTFNVTLFLLSVKSWTSSGVPHLENEDALKWTYANIHLILGKSYIQKTETLLKKPFYQNFLAWIFTV